MRLVVGAAGRFYLPHGLEREDLIQAGVAGLLRAIDKFDESRGTRFSTYAVPWIRQSIGRQIENTGSLVRLPIALQAEMARLRRAEAALSSTLGRLPTGEEAAREAGLSAEKLEVLGHARQVSSHAASLDAATEETDALFERLAAADPEPGEHTAAAEERAFQAAALRDAIKCLAGRAGAGSNPPLRARRRGPDARRHGGDPRQEPRVHPPAGKSRTGQPPPPPASHAASVSRGSREMPERSLTDRTADRACRIGAKYEGYTRRFRR